MPQDISPGAWYANPTWGRAGNLDLVCSHLADTFPRGCGTMVEVGSLHVPGRVATNGCSTAAWAKHAHEYGREFVSVDRHGPSIQNADKLGRIEGFRVSTRHGEAHAEVPKLADREIVLLYLDGDNSTSAALGQLKALEGSMLRGAVVLVDDAKIKGPEVADYLDGKGWPRIEGLDPYQWGWTRP